MNQLVPVKKGALVPYKNKKPTEVQPFLLVEERKVFETREEIKRYLPDICGLALARSWHDKAYMHKLETDIYNTFKEGGVILPEDTLLQFEKTSGQRAKITVYEQSPHSKFKLKVCSLSLNMIAQR